MLRRLGKSAIAHGLARVGADRSIGRLTGVGKEPLVLGYHRVVEDSTAAAPRGVPNMGVRVSTIERHLELVGQRFRFVSLDELGARIEEGRASGLAAVTFDDGYADFYEHGFPLLRRKGIPAAVFVVTGCLENGSGFLHDRVYAALENALSRWGARRLRAFLAQKGFGVTDLPDRAFPATRTLLRSLDQEALTRICATLELECGDSDPTPRSLTWDQVARMSRAGLTVASHTRTHTLLTRESKDRVIEEIAGSRAEIEQRLGVCVAHFAYPDGSFDAAAVRAVAAAGYRYAYTGCKHRDLEHPLLTLPRRVLWEGSTLGALGRFSAHVLSGQINGIFDLADRCSDDHGAALARARSSTAIAVVAPSLEVVGGQSVQAATLVKGLRQEGFPVLFLATNPRFPAGLRWLRRVPLVRTMLNQALYAASLLRLRQAAVVHVFSASFWSFLLAPAPAMLVARALGKRVILNYHSGEAEDHLRRWGLLVHPWLRLAHQIVVPSEYLRRVFAGHGYNTRAVRNVVETSRFGYRARAPLQPRLLSTRSLEPNYRVDVILSAFALLKAERPDATLTVVGCGSEEGRLRRMAGSIGGVTFLGRVAPEAMPQICASADVFLNASVVDNQPLSLLEAFASGLPVVTTATGGIAGMVRDGETGIIVPPLDPAAMAAAVLALLRDEDAALRIARGARRVAENHSWPPVRDQWTEVYSGRSIDAAPPAEDGDRRGSRQKPAGSLEVAREERFEKPAVVRAR
jgi:glycosyltransferase involved in cell wall biosynthesis/peptidoglycan/xylan/chitin deacetylase (PgdA/CDA1 family)